MSAAVRLAPFNLPQIRAITDHDDMDLYTLGEKKCALYAVIPDNDTTYNFLVSLLYSQVFQTLYYCADQIHHGPLPRHVHFILDEAPSSPTPPAACWPTASSWSCSTRRPQTGRNWPGC